MLQSIILIGTVGYIVTHKVIFAFVNLGILVLIEEVMFCVQF